MKYRKLQLGGEIVYTPMPSSGIPAPTVAPSGAAAESSGSSTYDDIYKELVKGDMGLENDVYDLINQLQQLDQTSNVPYLSEQNRNTKLAIYGKINEIKRNKEMWKEAYNTAKSSGGLNEVAVGSSGELYAYDKDNQIKSVTLDDYKKSKGKLRLLSVSDLLRERNENPNLTYNNNILDPANNSVSIKSISDYAKSIVSSLGLEKEDSEFIVTKEDALSKSSLIAEQVKLGNVPSAEVIKGFEILQHVADSPSNYSKVKQAQSSERNHATKAIKYIWSTLGDNAKNKLRVQAELSGQSVENLLMDMVIISTDISSSYSTSPVSEKVATGKASEGEESLTGAKNMTPTQIMMQGTLASADRKFVFNDPDFNSKFQGLIIGQKALTTADDRNAPIGPTTLEEVLSGGRWNELVQQDNIYFGNSKVSWGQMNDIIVDGQSDIAYVYLPANPDGSPDNQSLEEYKNLMDTYKEQKDSMTPGEVKRLFSNSGFDVTVNPDKTIEVSKSGSNIQPFLITFGYTNDGSGLAEDNDDINQGGLKKLNREESKRMASFEERAWTFGTGRNTTSVKPKTNIFNRDRYKGIIYMPVRHGGSVIGDALSNAGPKKPVYSETDVRRNAQNSSNRPYVKANIEALYDE